MNWIHIVYFITLIYLSTKLDDPKKRKSFRASWIIFAVIPLWEFLMHLFRAGNILNPKALSLVQVWEGGVSSLLFGISLLCFVNVLAPRERPVKGPMTKPPFP